MRLTSANTGGRRYVSETAGAVEPCRKARSGELRKEHDMRHDDSCGIQSQERRRSRLRRAGPLAAALAGVAILAAACSGGPASPGAGAGSPGGSGKTSELAYSQ